MKPYILIWTGEESLKGMISSLLGGEGFKALHASDQREMFRLLEEYQPPVVILDADLPRVMGYEVYELIKRIDRFKDVEVIVVSSAPHPGLDDTGQVEYVDRGQVQDLLLSKIRTLIPGESIDAGERDTSHISTESCTVEYLDMPVERTIVDGNMGSVPSSQHEEARRFARLIVSDIVLYNKEKAERGAIEGTFLELLGKEIEEGRRFYSSRIPEEILLSTHYYDEAIEEYVREMSMK